MKYWVWILYAALLASFGAGVATAGPAIDWDPAFTWEIGATATNSPPGGEFKEVGIISQFDSPFGDLNAKNPAVEYTFYMYGLMSLGTIPLGPPATTIYETHYSGGFIEVYCDSAPEPAAFDPNPPSLTVPSYFRTGTLILAGTFNSFVTQTNNFSANQVGNLEGEITWTGGTLLPRTIKGGKPCTGLITGGITWKPSVMAPYPGYIFDHDGKIDLNCPVAVEPSTWGTIKGLYR